MLSESSFEKIESEAAINTKLAEVAAKLEQATLKMKDKENTCNRYYGEADLGTSKQAAKDISELEVNTLFEGYMKSRPFMDEMHYGNERVTIPFPILVDVFKPEREK